MHRGDVLRLSPPATLSLLFLGLIGTGTVLLSLPFATTEPIGLLDAAFTATSAVTVTGLSVVDTGTGFTLFGQMVILVLIQLGGLGVMTFAVLVILLLGQRVGLRQSLLLREDLNHTSLGDLLRLVRIILVLVIGAEVSGALVLAVHWAPTMGPVHAFWEALFHAVSAFNNAGFSLWPDSLTRWVDDPVVNVVISALVILGGLGFGVIANLRRVRRWSHLSVHTRLMLVGTLGLIIWSVAATAVLEWDNPGTLGALHDTASRLWAAWFQGITTRTAGFNSVDIGALHDDTVLTYISLMFIGGGSASTAGGVKVTSFMVLAAATLAFLRRRHEAVVFGRTIRSDDILKVLALTFIGLLVVMIGTFLLLLTQHGSFLDLSFEAASAFGTVGLSRGVTGSLNGFGLGVLMALMFIGRIGPLALGFLLATPSTARIRYPGATIQLG